MKARWLVGMFVLVVTHAHAGFVVIDAPPKQAPPSRDACMAAGVREVGEADSVRPLIGESAGEPAPQALRRVVPRNWTIAGAAGVDRVVSWHGGRPWFSVAHDIAMDADLCLILDHAKKTATVHAMSAPAPALQLALSDPTPPPAALADVDMAPVEITTLAEPVVAESTGSAVDAVAQAETMTETIEVEVAEPKQMFELRGGDTLRQSLTRWCDDTGWVLQWQAAYDYPIEVGHVYPPGTSLSDAVRTTLRSYWNRPKPLAGRAYSNRVLLITGR